MSGEPEKITTLERLLELATEKKSVIAPNYGWRKPKPAAFIINMNAAQVLRMFKAGMYAYQKQEKKLNGND